MISAGEEKGNISKDVKNVRVDQGKEASLLLCPSSPSGIFEVGFLNLCIKAPNSLVFTIIIGSFNNQINVLKLWALKDNYL